MKDFRENFWHGYNVGLNFSESLASPRVPVSPERHTTHRQIW